MARVHGKVLCVILICVGCFFSQLQGMKKNEKYQNKTGMVRTGQNLLASMVSMVPFFNSSTSSGTQKDSLGELEKEILEAELSVDQKSLGKSSSIDDFLGEKSMDIESDIESDKDGTSSDEDENNRGNFSAMVKKFKARKKNHGKKEEIKSIDKEQDSGWFEKCTIL